MLEIDFGNDTVIKETSPQVFACYYKGQYAAYNLADEYIFCKRIFDETDYEVIYLNDEDKKRPLKRGVNDLHPDVQKFNKFIQNPEVQSAFIKNLFTVFASDVSEDLYKTLKEPVNKDSKEEK